MLVSYILTASPDEKNPSQMFKVGAEQGRKYRLWMLVMGAPPKREVLENLLPLRYSSKLYEAWPGAYPRPFFEVRREVLAGETGGIFSKQGLDYPFSKMRCQNRTNAIHEPSCSRSER